MKTSQILFVAMRGWHEGQEGSSHGLLVPSQCSRRLCLLWLAQRHIWRFQTFSNRCNRILWWLSADFFVVACFSREWKTYLATIYLDFPALAGNFRSQNTFIGIRAGAWRSSQESCKWLCSWTRLKTSKSNVKLCQIKYTASSAWSQLGTSWNPDFSFTLWQSNMAEHPWWFSHWNLRGFPMAMATGELLAKASACHWDVAAGLLQCRELAFYCKAHPLRFAPYLFWEWGSDTGGSLQTLYIHHMIWGVNLWTHSKYHYQWDFWQCVGCAGRWPLLIRQVPFGPCVCKWFK